jgi:hypothetical protein
MARMIRKQVYITPEHEAALKRAAAEYGVTEAEIIRRGIERIAAEADREEERRLAWQRFMAFSEERGKLPAEPTPNGRGWTRDELYDERLDRIARR